MATGDPEGRYIRCMGRLELDERRHQGLRRERPRRIAQRHSARLCCGDATYIHV